jgi:hypothetical protein
MNINNGKIKTLTMSAFGLALSVLSLILFRGPISIVSTLLIPAIIVLFSGNKLEGYAFSSIGLFIITLLFFPTQIIFVSGYAILGLLLKSLALSSNQKVKIHPGKFMLYLLITSLVLYMGLRLTELLFLVPLHAMMLGISRGSSAIYAGILILEGLFVSVFNFGILKLLISRINP